MMQLGRFVTEDENDIAKSNIRSIYNEYFLKYYILIDRPSLEPFMTHIRRDFDAYVEYKENCNVMKAYYQQGNEGLAVLSMEDFMTIFLEEIRCYNLIENYPVWILINMNNIL